MNAQEIQAMQNAIAAALAAHPDVAKYGGGNDVNTVLNAYMTGDWTGVVDLTGKPFTDEQQAAAVAEASRVLAPAYKATEAYDRSVTEDALRKTQEGFGQFQTDEAAAFSDTKDTMDKDAADSGVLFSGSRFQKLNDLKNTYADRERIQRSIAADATRTTARAHQYNYGNDAAASLSDKYQLPGSSNFNPGVAGGSVTRRPLSSVYSPSEFNFQGTKPVAQSAAVQTRAATQLANRANKLSLSGYGTKY